MMPHDILHILGSAEPEGAGIARIVAALARDLDPDHYQIHACFLGGDGPLAGDLERAGAHVRTVTWRAGALDPLGAWRFWRLARNRRPSLVHQHTGGRSVSRLARRAARAGLIYHLHGQTLEGPEGPGRRLPSPEADLVIATSRAVAAQVTGAGARVIYPGARITAETLPSAPGVRNGTVVIGAAGRLVPIKGLIGLVQAIGRLNASGLALRLEIAGSGPEQPALEREASRLRVQDRVAFLGGRENLQSTLAWWDIFVQPSLAEGFGIAALEAMAVGLPVVVSRVGGLPELVEDSRTGLLVPPGDPAALAQCLAGLARDPERRRALGTAGRERARERFSVEQMVKAIADVYAEILDSRVAGGRLAAAAAGPHQG